MSYPFILICFTSLACFGVRDDDTDIVLDGKNDVYNELTKAIAKELNLPIKLPRFVQPPVKKGTWKTILQMTKNRPNTMERRPALAYPKILKTSKQSDNENIRKKILQLMIRMLPIKKQQKYLRLSG
jgi:hypothetical protein